MPDHFDTLDLDGLRREAERLGYVRRAARAFGRSRADLPEWAAHVNAPVGVVFLTTNGWWTHGYGEADALRWLLRTDEAQVRAACYARGVADESRRLGGIRD